MLIYALIRNFRGHFDTTMKENPSLVTWGGEEYSSNVVRQLAGAEIPENQKLLIGCQGLSLSQKKI